MTQKPQYFTDHPIGPDIDNIIYMICAGFTEDDYLKLAYAALDQAGCDHTAREINDCIAEEKDIATTRSSA